MIRDRMPDLLRLAMEDPSKYNEPEHHEEIPIPPELLQILQRGEKVLKFLHEMENMIKDLKIHHQGVLTSASVLNANNLRQQIAVTTNRYTAIARKTKTILRRMELSDREKIRYSGYNHDPMSPRKADVTVKWEQASSSVQRMTNWFRKIRHEGQVSWHNLNLAPPSFIPAEIRIQMILHGVLTYSMIESVQQFYTEQKNYNVMSQRKIERQLSIMGKEMGPTEIGRAMDENIPLLQGDIQDDLQVRKEMRAKLQDVAHFEHEILLLERNITQLHQAFLMMSSLVQEQGVIIDRIEHHVIMAGDYVISSNQQLKKAGKLQHKYRKKRCILAVLIILVLAILAIVIALALKRNHNGNRTRAFVVAKPRLPGVYHTKL